MALNPEKFESGNAVKSIAAPFKQILCNYMMEKQLVLPPLNGSSNRSSVLMNRRRVYEVRMSPVEVVRTGL